MMKNLRSLLLKKQWLQPMENKFIHQSLEPARVDEGQQ
jgi:hypothetical protein